jgi:hypothetical protein
MSSQVGYVFKDQSTIISSKGRENTTIRINTQHIVLFKNPRDQIEPAIFARQMYLSHPKKFMILQYFCDLSQSFKYVCSLWGLSSHWLTSRVSLFIYSSTLPHITFGEQLLLSGTPSNIYVFNLSSSDTQHIVLFKNPRDQIEPAIFARQMYLSHPKKFMIKYTEATKRPYGYLFIDLKQNTPEDDRLKTYIFDGVPDNKSCSPNVMCVSPLINNSLLF